jgi:hypothetical protein
MRKVLAISMVLATAIFGGRVEPQANGRHEDATSATERAYVAQRSAGLKPLTRYLADGSGGETKRPNRQAASV